MDPPTHHHHDHDHDHDHDHPADDGPFVDSDVETEIDQRVFESIGPALNSGIPVYVSAASHAFVVCGYSRQEKICGDGSGVVYTVHDDQIGPYLQVYSPLRDFRLVRSAQVPRDMSLVELERSKRAGCSASSVASLRNLWRELAPKSSGDARTLLENRHDWAGIVLPLPRNIHISFDAAERFSLSQFHSAALLLIDEGQGTLQPDSDDAIDLDAALKGDMLSVRTYVANSFVFKSKLDERGFPLEITAEYGKCRLAANVHVTEIFLKSLDSESPRVIGEVILDSTSGNGHPWLHAMRIGGHLQIVKSDGRSIVGLGPFRLVKAGHPGAQDGGGRRPIKR